jgi:hypothetical protein
MYKFMVILIFTSVIVSGSAVAQDAGIIPPTVPPAPVGHAQPTARGFALNPASDRSEQRQLSAFDAEQHKLNICRC